MDIVDHVIALYQRVQQTEQRLAGKDRRGPVTDVDVEKKMARIRLGGTDAEPFKSGWLPYAQIAAPGDGLKVHWTPVVGQNMVLRAPSGELRQGLLEPMTWSDQAPSPGSADHPVMTFGNVRVEVKQDSVRASVGDDFIEIAAGKATIQVGGSKIEMTTGELKALAEAIKLQGSSLTHNDHNVGDSHVHTEVEPGGALSGPPP